MELLAIVGMGILGLFGVFLFEAISDFSRKRRALLKKCKLWKISEARMIIFMKHFEDYEWPTTLLINKTNGLKRDGTEFEKIVNDILEPYENLCCK